MTQANYLRFAVPLASAMLLAACGGGDDPAPVVTSAPPVQSTTPPVQAADLVPQPVLTPLPMPTITPAPNPEAPQPGVIPLPMPTITPAPNPESPQPVLTPLPMPTITPAPNPEGAQPAVPTPETVVSGITVAPFVQRARETQCGQYSNRLFVANKQYVFSAAEGTCASTAEQYVLYGKTADEKLCSLNVDDLRRAVKRGCIDAALYPLMDKLMSMQQRGDTVREGTLLEEIRFLPKEGTRLPFYSLTQKSNSGVETPRQQVIRDAATLASVWSGPVDKNMSPVNFETEMVIAVYGGNSGSCGQFGIRAVRSNGAALVVEYGQETVPVGTLCTLAINTPMQLVVVDRIDVPVTFSQVAPQAVALRTLEPSNAQTYGERQRLVIKDAQAWAALWKQHIQLGALPDIDFTKQMVVAAFAGGKPSGAYGLHIGGIERLGGKLRVTVIESAPGRYSRSMATTSLTNPVRLVVINRSDEPVEFVEQMSLYR